MTKPKAKQTLSKVKILEPGTVRVAVEAAMRDLPILFHDVIDLSHIAEHFETQYYEHLGDTLTQPITKTEIEKHLSRIKTQSAALLLTMRTARGGVIDALNSQRTDIEHLGSKIGAPTLGEMQTYLQWLNDAATTATAPDAAKDKKGPGFQSRERAVAYEAARVFFRLTQKQPTRSMKKGGFGKFLKEIFAALQIKSSMPDRRNDAVEWWKDTEKTPSCDDFGK